MAPSPDQARFFARLIRELVAASRNPSGRAFRDLPEYVRLLEGAYAMAFVSGTITARTEDFLPYLTTPERLRAADLRTVRRFLHYMLRAERHADAGSEHGGGSVYNALRAGALEIVAERLEGWVRPLPFADGVHVAGAVPPLKAEGEETLEDEGYPAE